MESSAINISILGGCALAQKDIHNELRFPTILKTQLSEENIKINLSLFSYTDILALEEKVIKKIKKEKTDILIIHIRPQPFNIRGKFILKQSINNKISYKINNLITGTPTIYSDSDHPLVFNDSPKKGKFEELNGKLGRLLGLHKKTAKVLLKKIYAIQKYCTGNEIELIVLGSPSQKNSSFADANNFYLDSFLQEHLTAAAIHYISCYHEFKLNYTTFLHQDGMHLSSQGHAFLGRLLVKEVLIILDDKKIILQQ